MMSTSKGGKKPLKISPDPWVCPELCDMTTGVPCKHLEKLLPQMRHKKVAYADTTNCSLDVFQAYQPTFDIKAFQSLMRNYGFVDDWEIELLTARWFFGMSLRKIADEFGWISFSTIRWKLKELNEELVKRGFEQELW